VSLSQSKAEQDKKIAEGFMRRALRLAKMARERTLPNPMVGAVIVKDGRIIAEGYHKRAGRAHAEAEALARAGRRARAADLYVTLEPCHCTGRTGPCTEGIQAAGIRRVFVGTEDPNPQECGCSLAELRSQGIEVVSGILEDECRRLNEVYNTTIQGKRPFVLFKAAASLDGRIAARTGDSRWISSKEARKFAHRLRAGSQAVMIGAGTQQMDDPSLNVRHLKGKNPAVALLDTNLSIKPKARLFKVKRTAPLWIYCSKDASPAKARRLESAGAEIIRFPASKGLPLARVMKDLLGRGVYRLLVEGGSRLIGSLIDKKMIDRVELVLAAMFLGKDGIPLASFSGPRSVAKAPRLEEMSWHRLGPDIRCSGRLVWPK
jgi:diaminohydroxyphosphoribosylaminopyrimidine deaminase / 5-amino-6-(5-phosphoribosylamino)uracil reductase